MTYEMKENCLPLLLCVRHHCYAYPPIGRARHPQRHKKVTPRYCWLLHNQCKDWAALEHHEGLTFKICFFNIVNIGWHWPTLVIFIENIFSTSLTLGSWWYSVDERLERWFLSRHHNLSWQHNFLCGFNFIQLKVFFC